jgi:hypothetical protein
MYNGNIFLHVNLSASGVFLRTDHVNAAKNVPLPIISIGEIVRSLKNKKMCNVS